MYRGFAFAKILLDVILRLHLPLCESTIVKTDDSGIGYEASFQYPVANATRS